jgi:hypothetical protein
LTSSHGNLPFDIRKIDGRLLFSITFGAEIYYAVKGKKTTVVTPRYVEDDEYKVPGNGHVQQPDYQNGGLRY